MIVIVGAGLAGLTCAKVLYERREPFMVLEASDGPGGRVRTDVSPSGYHLDRGFQVLFTAYPVARRHLSLAQLNLCRFDHAAIVVQNGKRRTVGDPLHNPGLLLPALVTSLATFGDKRLFLALRREVRRTPIEQIFSGDDTTALEFLRERGFSERFVENVARPLCGAIFLDRSLGTSAAMLRFTLKMLAEGHTVVPAAGMGAITEQLTRVLPINDVRYGARVAEVLMDGTRAYGVRTDEGVAVEADAVVVATDPPTAARLTGVPMPTTPLSTTCVYFTSPRSLYAGRRVVLNATPDAFVNNLVQITNVAPSYAPPGQHLVSATILGLPQGRDVDLAEQALEDVRRMFPRHDLSTLKPLAVVRVPFAQYAQSPGFYHRLPPNETGIAALIVASDGTLSSSIQGAMLSGQRAAEAALRAIDTGSLTPA